MAKIKDLHDALAIVGSIDPKFLRAILGKDSPGSFVTEGDRIVRGNPAPLAELLRDVADKIDEPDHGRFACDYYAAEADIARTALTEIQSRLQVTAGACLPEDGHDILAAAHLALGICNAALKVQS